MNKAQYDCDQIARHCGLSRHLVAALVEGRLQGNPRLLKEFKRELSSLIVAL